MVREFNVYAIYEGNELVCEGTCYDIAEKLNVPDRSVAAYWKKGSLLKGVYTVKFVGKTRQKTKYYKGRPRAREVRRVVKELNYADNPYECLLWHLKSMGNTSIPFDPSKFLDRLEEDGIRCRVTPIKDASHDGKVEARVTKRGRKPKPTYHYVVEVVT